MGLNKNQQALLELVKAGLWAQPIQGSKFKIQGSIDWEKVYQLAKEQAVVGLLAAGMENLNDNLTVNIPLALKLQIIGVALQIEQRNKEMNSFIADIVEKMRQADVYTLLVKGQGIAQCYEKPLWRTSGDIDFFLSSDNYNKAKSFFIPLSSGGKPERQFSKEWGMNIGSWYVELHGTQRTGLSTMVDEVVDGVQRTVFNDGKVRSTEFQVSGSKVQVFLPAADEDVFFVFTHFIKHFYKEGGVSIRQLCDWCRLLWKYRDSLDSGLLESRIRKAGLMAEWRAFAKLAVDYLGMPVEAMPLFDLNADLDLNKKKAEKILTFILKGGEWRRFKDTVAVGRIFPLNTLRFAPGILFSVTWLKVKERCFKH